MITANELKTKGIKAIEEQLSQTSEVAITVHGKVKYVAMTVELFDKMRLAELEVAYMLCKKDIEEGNYTIETAEEHVERLWK
ncbi:MAG: prevent-host-death protein [Saprospiraceae bacterium]|nr:prevent-host-death protein [Saprospiraceae bacterium]MBK8668876.1 prevent-host-death protein [Saprospiraceae bacterium]MBL0102022.1 prevent-host-death protein [Saprospiraceae bacterium]